jgi:hypothetical protein
MLNIFIYFLIKFCANHAGRNLRNLIFISANCTWLRFAHCATRFWPEFNLTHVIHMKYMKSYAFSLVGNRQCEHLGCRFYNYAFSMHLWLWHMLNCLCYMLRNASSLYMAREKKKQWLRSCKTYFFGIHHLQAQILFNHNWNN